MPRPIRRAPALLLLALLGGCALPHAATTADPPTAPTSESQRATAPASESLFAGIGGVDVLVFTALPDEYAAPRGLRSLAVREHVRARLATAGIPLRPETEAFDMNRPNFRLDVESFAISADEHAVWLRVSLGETTRLRRRPERPLMITTWAHNAKTAVRGDGTAPLWAEINRLTDAFIREYQEANGILGTDPV